MVRQNQITIASYAIKTSDLLHTLYMYGTNLSRLSFLHVHTEIHMFFKCTLLYQCEVV